MHVTSCYSCTHGLCKWTFDFSEKKRNCLNYSELLQLIKNYFTEVSFAILHTS